MMPLLADARLPQPRPYWPPQHAVPAAFYRTLRRARKGVGRLRRAVPACGSRELLILPSLCGALLSSRRDAGALPRLSGRRCCIRGVSEVAKVQGPNAWWSRCSPATPQQTRKSTFQSKLKPRPYQIDAVKHFFDHAQASGQHPLRIQMACGTGQTLVYGMIISRDLEAHPYGRHVIFVPWCDLARQTAVQLEAFDLQVGVVGDGTTEVDLHARVLVCVYASAHRLQGQFFRTKIVDEAHHLSDANSLVYRQVIRQRVGAHLTADFSATFKGHNATTYNLNLDSAIKQGHVSDFVLTAAFFSPGADSVTRTIQLVAQRRAMWAPLLLVCSRLDQASRCATELTKLGVNAAIIDGNTPTSKREAAKEALRSGALQALCVVNVLNEGTSISELRTVVLTDKRLSQVGLQQVAMRLLGKHSSKPAGNLVVPLELEPSMGFDGVLCRLVSSISAISPVFEQRIRARESRWLRAILVEDTGVSESAAVDELMFRRLHTCLTARFPARHGKEHLKGQFRHAGQKPPEKGMQLAEWHAGCKSLGEWVEQHRCLPHNGSTIVEEQFLHAWLLALQKRYSKGLLTERQISALVVIPGMEERLSQWGSVLRRPLDWPSRCIRLGLWVERHDGALPQLGAQDAEQRSLAVWAMRQQQKFLSGRLTQVQLAQLWQVPGMRTTLQTPRVLRQEVQAPITAEQLYSR